MIARAISQYVPALVMYSALQNHRLLKSFPAATSKQAQDVAARAIKQLGQSLAPEYLQLVLAINGGGYDVCFYRTHTQTVSLLGRQLQSLGIIEKNLQLRDSEFLGPTEIAYAQGEGCVFMPVCDGASWVGRNMVSRAIEWQFASFEALLQKVYR